MFQFMHHCNQKISHCLIIIGFLNLSSAYTKDLQVTTLGMIYLHNIGPEYWSLIFFKTKLSKEVYFSSTDLVHIDSTKEPFAKVYRIDSGRWNGYDIHEHSSKEGLILSLMTKEIVEISPKLATLIKSRSL